ncbi:Glutamate synthase (NADPH) small chain [Verrucomicrobia bacterium]|nr:Glutamate synthase (NADPH) small chain [Verrucomicrobiota bacterium]
MEPPPPPSWKAKYAWLEIERTGPPKRPAERRISDFHEIYSLYDEATIREQASRCIQCPEASCVKGCPLSNRIPEWVNLAAEGDFLGAAEISRSTSNMPEICSRVCPQERLCEGSCILNGRSEPICIGAIEKFINEYALARGAVEVRTAPPNGLSVAVVGSGPAGLACADELVKVGYAVTVFESQTLPGGLLMNGIPAFKLEKSVVERRVELLRRRGVSFRLGVTVGQDIGLDELLSRFDAVFLGIGAQRAKPLDVPGADLRGVFQSLPFLIQKNVSLPLEVPPIDVAGKRVVTLGGGDTAMDCLRTAIRCGASEAACLYRRDLANMPGSRKEYANAVEEGAQFLFLTNPVSLEGNDEGTIAGVRCLKMELGEPDSSGRRKPRAVRGSEFFMAADVILVAYGFDPVPFPAGTELAPVAVNDWGGVIVDQNQMTSVPGVFAGGDDSRGPSLVVHAVRDGRKAAQGIQRYLSARKAR